jgi:Ras GTPase-activating-like protein IQGAP2/3
MLLECEPSIVLFQALLRGFHFRQDVSRTQSTLHLAEPSVLRFQSRARGALTRRKLCDELEERSSLNGMAESLQAGARGVLSRRRWRNKVEAVHQASSTVIQIQACARASLARVRMRQTRQTHLQASSFVTKLQAQSRGHIGRAFQKQQATHLQNSSVQQSLTLFQAFARGSLARRRRVSIHQALLSIGSKGTYSALQDQIRGVLLRKKLRTQVQTLDQATSTVIAIQSQARGALVRGRRENTKHEFESTSAAVVSLQALARARLARQSYKGMQKVFRKVEVTSSIGGLQALLRSRLAKKSTTEQKKRLDFVAPDVVGFQALSRGVLARREYHDWVNYLKEDETQAGITFLQQLLRGQMARRRLWSRLDYIYSNMHSIIKVQALWRGRKQREKYRKIVTGQHVDIAAIQNYMHLLDDSEHDFNEQVQIERMRKQVVDRIRTNQLLESQVLDLDKKIALILQNRLSFEDLVRVKGRLNTASEARVEDQTFNMARSDPFSHDAQLDKSLWHRRELYQRMFFILQTEPKYLARLLRLQTASDASEQDRRLLQSVILALYSYGQGRREEYLLLKMLQVGSRTLLFNHVYANFPLPKSLPFTSKSDVCHNRNSSSLCTSH